MGINALFAVLLIAFVVVWAFWLYGISRDSVRMMIGGALAIAVVAAALIAVNSERLDRQRQDYGELAVAALAATAEAQEAEFDSAGTYADDVELNEELLTYDDGALTFERGLELSITDPSKQGYQATAEIEGQEFALVVTRRGGTVEQERTCDAAVSELCVDETWEESGA